MPRLLIAVPILTAVLAAAPMLAQDTTARRLPAVVVTRDKERSPLDLPYAISSTRPDSVSPGQPHTLPEQTLSLLPGVTVANRTNPSQDARVSIRGFGARSQFGVRSLRILRDGMPLTMPDGQTPIDYLDLEAVSRVETLRGSASSLYGNASGGVIDLRSPAPPATTMEGQLRAWFGSNGMQRQALMLGGTESFGWFQGNIGRTRSNGARSYSHQDLNNAYLRAGTERFGTQFTLVGLGLHMPTAQNPGALLRVQYDSSARKADTNQFLKKARKEVDQFQIGLTALRPWRGSGDVQAHGYLSTRTLFNPLTFAIVGIDRRTSGASLRAMLPANALGLSHRFTAGVDAQRLSDARKNWANCNNVLTPTANCPAPLPIERGRVTLDQRETVTSFGAYVRDEIERGRTRLTLGVRADNTKFDLADHFTSEVVPRDDSGERTMSAVSPMAGLSFRLRPNHAIYGNISTAFETPTTTEMTNKPDSSAGLNPLLDPQLSTTYEAGFKGSFTRRLMRDVVVTYDGALFTTRLQDELIGFDIGNNRVAFRNAGETRRRGIETALAFNVGPFALSGAYTYSQFEFVDYVSGTTQYKGKAIPGIPEHQVQTSLTWHHRRGFGLVEWQAKDSVWVNDANNTAAPAFALVNVRGGLTLTFGRRTLSPVFGVQNLFDRQHIGSVAINAAITGGNPATGRYYEPGAGRTWYAGISAATSPW